MLAAFSARSCPPRSSAARLLLVPGLREPQPPTAAVAAASAPVRVWGLLGPSRASAPAPRTDA